MTWTSRAERHSTSKYRPNLRVLAITVGLKLLAACSSTSTSVQRPAKSADLQPSCTAVIGAERVLVTGTIVMLGEMHGTREFPAFYSALACAAAARGKVAVGLEIPRDEDAALQRYLASRGGDADREVLLASGFWSRTYQDGRSSVAMFSLVEDLRKLAEATKRVRVFVMDAPSSAPRVPAVRERAMADAVLAAHSADPDEIVLTLTGNIHNRTRPGVPWDPAYVAMGALVVATGARVISLDGVFRKGDEWACASAEESSCGVKALDGRSNVNERTIEIFESPTPEGFYGRFTIGVPSASAPAISTRP